MTTSQVQGVQSPLEYLLGDGYTKVNFDLPDNNWTLDNTNRVPDLFELGRQAGKEQFDRVAEEFFAKPSRKTTFRLRQDPNRQATSVLVRQPRLVSTAHKYIRPKEICEMVSFAANGNVVRRGERTSRV